MLLCTTQYTIIDSYNTIFMIIKLPISYCIDAAINFSILQCYLYRNYHYLLKLVFIGNSKTGKTSLLTRMAVSYYLISVAWQ